MDIDPRLRLDQCPPLQLNVQIASPIKERLEALRELANDAGAGASLKDILSALVLDAPEDKDVLLAAILRYRTSSARDAEVQDGEIGDVLAFRRRPRGPRPRARAR